MEFVVSNVCLLNVSNLQNLSAEKSFQLKDSIVLGGKADSPKTKSPKKLLKNIETVFALFASLPVLGLLTVLLPAARVNCYTHNDSETYQHLRDRAFTLQPPRVVRWRLCREGRQTATSLHTQP